MAFIEKISKIIGYKDINFFRADSIGVIARGPSIRHLDICVDKFDKCFLAGEFNKNLEQWGEKVKGKDIVLSIVQSNRYCTPIEICRKYNIKNMQVNFHRGSSKHKVIQMSYPDLNVVGYTSDQSSELKQIFRKWEDEDNMEKYFVNSTGIAGVFHASYFRPKEVHIIGVDFYNTLYPKYLIGEPHDIPSDTVEKSANNLQEGMVEDFHKIAYFYSNIRFYIYTTFRGISSLKNISVIYVD